MHRMRVRAESPPGKRSVGIADDVSESHEAVIQSGAVLGCRDGIGSGRPGKTTFQ